MDEELGRRMHDGISRRSFLSAAAGALLATILQACRREPAQEAAPTLPDSPASPASPGQAQALAPTPACGDDDEPTEAQTEGPFFKTSSPERTNFRTGAGGGPALVLSGAVLSTACQPINRAKMELWHADGNGEYDNDGFRFRGHFFTDAQGRYQVETIVPGRYTGRTRHYHVKVQPPGGRVLTTQLYFPDEPGNSRDGIFDPTLLMSVRDTGDGKAATFDFVVQV
jgi:protocatechuate 3,4-dioxygenase beta subunit